MTIYQYSGVNAGQGQEGCDGVEFHKDPVKEPKDDKIHVVAQSAICGATSSSSTIRAPILAAAAAALPIEGAKSSMCTAEAIASTKPLARDFTSETSIEQQREAHESAKKFLQEQLRQIGTQIEFISPPRTTVPELSQVEIEEELNAAVYTYEYTAGVTDDMKADGTREGDEEVIYGVASQFNGAESMSQDLVPVGEAVRYYRRDRTQGPQAQLAYSADQVELINCGAHRGFNGLCKVLDEETKGEVTGGYLTPTRDASIGKKVVQLLKEKGSEIEYICLAAKPDGGTKNVHAILVAAPALGMYDQDGVMEEEDKEELQFVCALHSFRAQFELCSTLADRTGKHVVFKPVAVGLGAFGNNGEIVAKAFYQAAQEYQNVFLEKNVKVKFQVFKRGENPDGRSQAMASDLHLTLETK